MVHVEAGVACQPRLDRWCLVGAVVVTDDVHVQALTDCLVDLGGERFELDGPVLAVQGGDHRPVRRVERREQAGHAVADIVLGARSGMFDIMGNAGWLRASAWTWDFSSKQ